jgi:putative DNA primase/helicase
MAVNNFQQQGGNQPRFVVAYDQVAKLGLWGFPVTSDGTKLPCVKWKDYQDRPPSPDELADWRKRYHSASVGIPTGIATGIIVIDADNADAICCLESRGLPKTWTVRTRRGRHYYFAHPDFTVTNSAGLIADHVDVRGRGGFVVAPGSLGKDSFVYNWETSPDDVALANLPDWMADLVRPKPQPKRPPVEPRAFAGEMSAYARKALEGECDRLSNAGNGTRNDTAARVGFNLGTLIAGGELDDADVRASLYQIADGWPNPTKTRDTIDRALEAGKAHPRSRPKTDLRVVRRETQPETPAGANDESGDAMGDILIAEKFLAQHRENVRWCPTRGWLIWDKRRWQWDDREQIVKLAEQTVRGIYREAAATKDKDGRESLIRLAGTYSKAERIRAMLTIARPHVAVIQDDLDRGALLLNCRNGTINLRDGSILPHDRDNLITKLVDIDYLGDESRCPRFEQFMIEVFQGRTDLIEYVRRATGYGFSGDQREQCLHFLHGAGANGKTTLVQILLQAAGEYGQTAPAEMLLAQRERTIPTDVARLCGARFVAVSETGEGRALDEAAVKNMTGGDRIPARHMYRDWFEFSPTHHIFLSSNHKPTISGTDLGIWRRINLIPFNRKFEGKEQDAGLADELRQELPGILSWVVRGAVAWFAEGRLRPPEEVTTATAKYRSEQDVLAEFIGDCCKLSPDLEVPAKELYAAYHRWAEEAGEKRPWTSTRFGMRLTERGFKADRPVHRGGVIRYGLALLPEQGGLGIVGHS